MSTQSIRGQVAAAHAGWRVPGPASSIATTEGDLLAIEVMMEEHATDCQTFGAFPAQTDALLVRMVRHLVERGRDRWLRN